MARTPSGSNPTYCHHRRNNKGYVTIDGKQHTLPGPYNSDESRAAYDRLVGRWLASGRTLPPEVDPEGGPTVSIVLAAFWKHCEAHYRKPDGTPTGEADNYAFLIRPLRRLYGATPATSFGPKALKAFRSAMLLPQEVTDRKTGKPILDAKGKPITRPGWSRTHANRSVNRIRMMFKWAVAEEMIPASVYEALRAVEALRIGSSARESAPVEPVAEETVTATLPHLAPPVRAMVRLQLYTGARGGELFKLRPCDIDTSGTVWKARLLEHKTLHHGHARILYFGPRSREVLQEFLTPARPTHAYLFSPAEAQAWMKEQKRLKRKTPVQPSQRLREQERAKRKLKALPHFTREAYAQAIRQACARAKLPDWHPHQLRHTAGTIYRREGAFESAKIVLGHRSDSMTQNYAERDARKAEEIVARIG